MINKSSLGKGIKGTLRNNLAVRSHKEWFEAIVSLDIEKIKKMLEDGFNINTTTYNERNALHELEDAPRGKEEDVIEIMSFLIDKGINIEQKNSYDETPLILPNMIEKFPKVTNVLVQRGANTFQKNKFGFTLLNYAFAFKRTELIKELLELGNDINHEVEKDQTIAELAMTYTKTYKYNVLSELIKYQNKLNQKQKEIVEKEKLRILFNENKSTKYNQ